MFPPYTERHRKPLKGWITIKTVPLEDSFGSYM